MFVGPYPWFRTNADVFYVVDRSDQSRKLATCGYSRPSRSTQIAIRGVAKVSKDRVREDGDASAISGDILFSAILAAAPRSSPRRITHSDRWRPYRRVDMSTERDEDSPAGAFMVTITGDGLNVEKEIDAEQAMAMIALAMGASTPTVGAAAASRSAPKPRSRRGSRRSGATAATSPTKRSRRSSGPSVVRDLSLRPT
jgi:hypothetical protein